MVVGKGDSIPILQMVLWKAMWMGTTSVFPLWDQYSLSSYYLTPPKSVMICSISKHHRSKADVKKTFKKGYTYAISQKQLALLKVIQKRPLDGEVVTSNATQHWRTFKKDKRRVCSFLLTHTKPSRKIKYFFSFSVYNQLLPISSNLT